jgi:hypothetical protein
MKSKFFRDISEFMYQKRYAKKTIETYLTHITNFIRFHKFQHPYTMHDKEVESYLSYLVCTQNELTLWLWP